MGCYASVIKGTAPFRTLALNVTVFRDLCFGSRQKNYLDLHFGTRQEEVFCIFFYTVVLDRKKYLDLHCGTRQK